MRRPGTLILFVLAGAVALAWGLRGPGASDRGETEGGRRGERPASAGRLVGVVVDGEGAPIPGAGVRTVPGAVEGTGRVLRLVVPAGGRAVEADRDGRFSLACSGDVRLRVTAPGFVPAYVVLGPGEHEVELERGRDVTLFAVDPARAPVPGVVALLYTEPHEGWPKDAVDGDASGRVRLRVGAFDRVLLRAPGFRTTPVGDPVNGIRVTMEPGRTLRGIVVGGAGRGVGGAAVTVSQARTPRERVRTEPDGSFSFDGLGPRECGLTVTAPGFLAFHGGADPGKDDVRIELRRAVRQAGVVVFPDGSPAEGAAVRIGGAGPVFTDARGRFELGGLAPGPAEAEASHGAMEAVPGERSPPPAYRATATVNLPSARPLRLTLVERPRSFVPWRFTDESGAPAAGVRVEGAGGRSGEDGRAVSAFHVPAGTEVEAVVSRRGWRRRVAVTTRAEPGGPPHRVTVRELRELLVIARTPDGGPLPEDVRATIDGPTRRLHRPQRDRRVVAVDPDADRVWLHVRAPGYARRRGRFPVPADGVLEVRLAWGAVLRGRVVEPGGQAAGRATIVLHGERGSWRTEPDGSFEIRAAPAGPIDFRVWRADGHGARREVEAKDGDVLDLGTIVLAPPRGVEGRVTGPDGRPLEDVRVRAGRASARTGADGRFRLRMSAFFAGRVSFTKAGYGLVERTVEGPLDVRLERAGRVRVTVSGARGPRRFFARRAGAEATFAPRLLGDPRAPAVVLYDLPPGELEIGVEAANGTASVVVAVVPGATVEAALRLP